MKLKASAGRHGKQDLRDHCEILDLRAGCEDEAAWMAQLYGVITFGGTLTIEPASGLRATVVLFDGISEKGLA